MSKINFNDVSVNENRNLKKYNPFFNENGKINYEWGKDFEEFFNDRFNKRDKIVNLYHHAKNIISNNIADYSAFRGQDGWWFSEDSFYSIKVLGKTLSPYTNDELQKIAVYLQSVNDWCKKNNKKFYFFIPPNNQRIYPEYFPSFIRKPLLNNQQRTQQLLKYLQDHTNIKVIYPIDLLIEHKKDGLLYWKTDTHWNELGAFWGYFALMHEISKDFNIKPIVYENLKETYYYRGDLSRPYISIEDDKTIYWVPNIMKEYKEFIERKQYYIFLENNSRKYNIVMFRDSFSTLMLPYLGNTFRKVSALGYLELVPKDLEYIKNDNADIVIFEMLESSLVNLINYEFPQEEK
jgi:hypothetical protein